MTAEEQLFAYKELEKNGQTFFVEDYADCDRIIEALEKQIPKKPHKNRNEYYCPKCAIEGDHILVGKTTYKATRQGKTTVSDVVRR